MASKIGIRPAVFEKLRLIRSFTARSAEVVLHIHILPYFSLAVFNLKTFDLYTPTTTTKYLHNPLKYRHQPLTSSGVCGGRNTKGKSRSSQRVSESRAGAQPSDHHGGPLRLRPGVPELDDLVTFVARDEDLVVVHKYCTNLTFQINIDANSLQNVA